MTYNSNNFNSGEKRFISLAMNIEYKSFELNHEKNKSMILGFCPNTK